MILQTYTLTIALKKFDEQKNTKQQQVTFNEQANTTNRVNKRNMQNCVYTCWMNIQKKKKINEEMHRKQQRLHASIRNE